MKFVNFFASSVMVAGVVLGAAAPASADVAAELKAKIEGMSTEQQAALLLLLSQLGSAEAAPAAEAAAAEAPAATPADPKEAVKAAITKFGTSAAAGDMEGMLSVFSESFEHYQYGDKKGVGEFLQQSADMGYLEGIEFHMDDAEFEEDGDTISVYPVDVEGSFGSVTFEYILKNENGEWKIVEFDASGL